MSPADKVLIAGSVTFAIGLALTLAGWAGIRHARRSPR